MFYKKVIIVLLLIFILLLTVLFTHFKIESDKATNNQFFIYYGEVVTPILIGAQNIKDPDFFRYANHSSFRDDEGYYYIVVTDNLYPAILRTKNLKTYEFVVTIRNLVGKVAPYIIYEPQENRLCLFYSDWLNIIQGD